MKKEEEAKQSEPSRIGTGYRSKIVKRGSKGVGWSLETVGIDGLFALREVGERTRTRATRVKRSGRASDPDDHMFVFAGGRSRPKACNRGWGTT